jgi:hypothetical protein
LDAVLEPAAEVLKAPVVHPDLAATVALPVLCRGGRYAEPGRWWLCAWLLSGGSVG